MKKAIIIGATSGIGQEVARLLVRQGWRIGIAGRREEILRGMQQTNPEQIEMQCLDVTEDNAILHLNRLVDRLGGMDLFFLSSGVGYQNRNLEPEIELNTAHTNVEGFTRMVTAAFDYFKKNGWRTYRCNQFHSGHQGAGCSTRLLRHQAVSEYVHRRFGATFTDAAPQHPLHRYPSGLRSNGLAAERQVPDADACRRSSPTHRPGIKT